MVLLEHQRVWFVRYDELCRGLMRYVHAAPWVPISTFEWILKSRKPLNISHTPISDTAVSPTWQSWWCTCLWGQSTALFTQDVETGWSQHPGPDSYNTCVLESVITSQSLVLGLNKDHEDCTYTVATAGIHRERHPPCSWTFYTCPLSLKACKQLLLSHFKSLLTMLKWVMTQFYG